MEKPQWLFSLFLYHRNHKSARNSVVCVCDSCTRTNYYYKYTVIPRLTSDPANEFFG